MNRVALAIRTASEDALCKASLEALASDMIATNVSMEQQVEDLDDMIQLAQGLESVVVSVESFGEVSLSQQRLAREQALSYLTISGLSFSEAVEIFPSLESEGGTSAWEKFKAFLVKLWNFITEAAKKIFEYVTKVIKKSSLAEKAAMMQLRHLRMELNKQRNGLTQESTIKLRPAHRYIFNLENKVQGLSGLQKNIDTYQLGLNAIQKELPAVIDAVSDAMVKAVDNLSLTGTDQEISISVEKNVSAIFDAVKPMFPEALARALGAHGQDIPLIYDRAIHIKQPLAQRDSLITEDQVKEHLAQFGIDVVQVYVPAFDPDDMGTFPALRIVELERILKMAEKLIDEGHSADQQRHWSVTSRKVMVLASKVDTVVKNVLKKKDLSEASRTALKVVLNARHAMSRWAAAPYMQINAVNVRVVNSMLSLVSDQLKNYELTDSIQEKIDKAKEEEKTRKDKASKSKDAKSDK